MTETVNDAGLDIIFRTARSYNGWQDKPVSPALLQAVYELMIYGPTSANCEPARIVFVTSPEAKERLKKHLLPTNVDKVLGAPATAILGYDLKFYEEIPRLFPHNPGAREWFSGDEKLAETTAFRNGTLQGAYLIIAARALGLDCGPMSGFDNAGIDQEFFAGTTIKSNFICALGHGDPGSIFDRSPRLPFEDACQVL